MTFDINTGIGSIADLVKTVVTRVVADPTQQAEIALKIQELQQSGELAKLTNASELFKAEVDDRKSARDRDTQVNISTSAPLISKIITPILAMGVIFLTFVLFGLVIFSGNQVIDASKKDIVIYVLGALSAILSQVVSYYFGSTSASTKRNDAMVDIIKNS